MENQRVNKEENEWMTLSDESQSYIIFFSSIFETAEELYLPKLCFPLQLLCFAIHRAYGLP